MKKRGVLAYASWVCTGKQIPDCKERGRKEYELYIYTAV